ncbi:Trichohyalin like [Actinidia chinensis var. chinensis]|uniref:Trichohyalin like n=1 Tax=Actinidia chinensis var. chinensis TaxID=1590841 RepID=A0A2R6QFM3_ACTCC|nr:Trichohyalin like [Actinidia chinensis var. chinensis]
MFSLLLFIALPLLLLLLLLLLSLHKRFKKTEQQSSNSIAQCPLSKFVNKTEQTHESDPTHLTHSLLLEILPSISPKWATLFCDDPGRDGSGLKEERADSGGEDCAKKKKKKRAKKKRPSSPNLKSEERVCEKEDLGAKERQELVCLYPFTSSSSSTQRKIKQQYDQLVKSHESDGLTLAQVGQFVNCLIEARNELQHKSDVIQRKFTITKALLFKADRSSFDRLRQQIYRLELEQKRLEEDAFVYNWLQQQLKLSPAYKKILEISECMEVQAKSSELAESADADFSDISFEELLAQEKKDSFWQKNGKPRTCSG